MCRLTIFEDKSSSEECNNYASMIELSISLYLLDFFLSVQSIKSFIFRIASFHFVLLIPFACLLMVHHPKKAATISVFSLGFFSIRFLLLSLN